MRLKKSLSIIITKQTTSPFHLKSQPSKENPKLIESRLSVLLLPLSPKLLVGMLLVPSLCLFSPPPSVQLVCPVYRSCVFMRRVTFQGVSPYSSNLSATSFGRIPHGPAKCNSSNISLSTSSLQATSSTSAQLRENLCSKPLTTYR